MVRRPWKLPRTWQMILIKEKNSISLSNLIEFLSNTASQGITAALNLKGKQFFTRMWHLCDYTQKNYIIKI